MGHYDVGTEYFSCEFLSAYSSEGEHLFCGGYRPLRFISIYELSHTKCKNYKYFIKSLVLFDNAIKGYPLTTDNDSFNKTVATKIDYRIISMLINHYREIKQNKFPTYINETFQVFCYEKSIISIDLNYMMIYYKGFMDHFISQRMHVKTRAIAYDDIINDKTDNDNNNDNNDNKYYVLLLKYNFIVSLFKNCKEIVVSNDMQLININTDDYDEILSVMDNLNQSQLDQIKIINPTSESVTKLYSQYVGLFKKCGWILHKLTSQKINVTETNIQLITRKQEKSASGSVFAKMAKIFGQK